MNENLEIKTSEPYFVTVCSGKGGVGKSIVTSNLAYKLSLLGLKILVWDADSQFPNQHFIYGVEPPMRASNVYSGQVSIDKAIYKIADNLDLIADLPAAGLAQEYSQGFILDALATLQNKNNYDLIFFDTPSGAGSNVMQCTSVSDLIIIIINDEPTSLLDAYGLIKIFLQNLENKKILLLVNNVIDSEDALEMSHKLNLATKRFLNKNFDTLGYIPYNREIRNSILSQELFISNTENSELINTFDIISENILKKLNLVEI